MKTEARLVEFWLIETRVCVLCSVDHALEVRLYDRGKLVGLEPCRTPQEGLTIAHKWRGRPPSWPPY